MSVIVNSYAWRPGRRAAATFSIRDPLMETFGEGGGGRAAGIGDRIRWIIEDRLRTSHAEFSRRLAVKPPQLSRWINRPDYPPGEGYLARIAELGGVPVAWLRYGVGDPMGGEENGAAGEPSSPSGDELAAQDLFRHFEGMVRRMGGADVAPEELRLRKLDVIEGLTRLYAAQGVVPGWVYDLKGRILRDEL